ncbi:MAG: AraC family transcriptional regulator [Klebsiella huaxiensis]|uniref:helix-turn-helix transcriptional regulator n=1 Tax=Klebsiella huaxiensis TaxID=2153354 RepID=UPI0026EE175C|nr:AraC family transcriptional regulator [Klebsiella huaxiensis]WEJ90049.1 MAG: AraC family transcriptional regulator [Klebsiella huaxiensis]
MQQRDRDDEHRFFSSLAMTFSRATGLVAVVIDTRGERLPDRYAGLNFFSLPLMCFEKVWGYIICDHSKAIDNSHRLAAERLLHFIVNNVTPVEGIKAIANKQSRRNSDFYYAQRAPHEIKMASALRYIDEHLYDELSLESVAAHVCLSANYFSRFFKKQQGVNFKVWVSQKRMQRAGELLGDPAYSIDGVARKLQYAQTSYFCRVFRMAHRTTPQSFRQQSLSASS